MGDTSQTHYKFLVAIRGFHKLDEIGNIGIRGFTIYLKTKKSSDKMLPPVRIEPLIPSPTLPFLS